jgi:hypothetical protein
MCVKVMRVIECVTIKLMLPLHSSYFNQTIHLEWNDVMKIENRVDSELWPHQEPRPLKLYGFNGLIAKF